MKMHKNCCHQSCSFWLRYAPNRLSAYSAPPYPLAGLGMGPGERKEGGEGKWMEGKGGEGVPECPNPELASLRLLGITCNEEQTMSTLFAESSSDSLYPVDLIGVRPQIQG